MTTAFDAYRIETRVLKVGMYTALAMAATGIGFAYAANSQVILFDGLFNVLLFQPIQQKYLKLRAGHEISVDFLQQLQPTDLLHRSSDLVQDQSQRVPTWRRCPLRLGTCGQNGNQHCG